MHRNLRLTHKTTW